MKSKKSWLRIIALLALLSIVALFSAVYVSHEIAWRFTVLRHKLAGKIPEIPLVPLLKWMKPGSPVYLGNLAGLPNVYSTIVNTQTDAKSAAAGARIYGSHCAECHGDNARGQTGPNLVAALPSMSDWTFFSTVKWGRRGTIMVPQPLSDQEIWQVHAFVRQTTLAAETGKSALKNALPAMDPVTSDMLLKADDTGKWLSYSGDFAGFRHGRQSQISRRNVQNLRLVWAAQLPGQGMPLESTPIVAGDRMFVTESPEGVTALNASNGGILWQFHRPVPEDSIPLCCGAQNRGVAILGDTLFVGTLDAHLIALDAATGTVRWDTQVGDWHQGYSMTGAPLIVGDQVVVGVGGGDMGIRGFVAAYSTANGSQKWKFTVVPGPGEPGNETWGNNSWQHGGVGTWNTGAYDPDLGLIYWGTGNPTPAYFAGARPGSNLYANSLVALDAQTGKLRWYFQFTPSDTHDWDATQQPILADVPLGGEMKSLLMFANRNAFFYLLDRKTGQFLQGTAFAKQTWASGMTSDGHPIVRPESQPSRLGSLVWPPARGATNWWPPSYDPKRRLLYVPTVNAAAVYYHDQPPRFKLGQSYAGSSFERAANEPSSISLQALDVTTGQKRWETVLASGGPEVKGEMGGVLSTEGDLIFVGYAEEFFALDSDTGKKIWSTPLGTEIHAPAITYTEQDRQYVSVIVGRTLFTFGLPQPDEETDSTTVAQKHLTSH